MTALHMEGPHANQEPVGLGGNQSRTSDRALRRMERELKRGKLSGRIDMKLVWTPTRLLLRGRELFPTSLSLHITVIMNGRSRACKGKLKSWS